MEEERINILVEIYVTLYSFLVAPDGDFFISKRSVIMFEFMKRNSSTIELIIGIVFVLVAVGLIILAVKYEKNNKSKASPIRKMTTLSILAALSIVLYYFVKFPLGAILPIPGFLDIHFSNVRSEEHTSELQSRPHLVCRLLLEKEKEKTNNNNHPITNHTRTRRPHHLRQY